MELSPCEKFLLDDSSDSDDSNVETLLVNYRHHTLVMALAVKEHEERTEIGGEDRPSNVFAFLEIAISRTRC